MSYPFDHNEARRRRHRLWSALVALALCAGAAAWAADWLAPAPDSVSQEVAVALPPAPKATSSVPAAKLSALSPAAGRPSVHAQSAPQSTSARPAGGPVQEKTLPEGQTLRPKTAAAPVEAPAQSAGKPAWLRFAAAAPVDAGDQPRVAIVIDDLGLDRPRTERVIGLPAAVTLSFLAYAGDLPQLTAQARRRGHELLVHVPMEPIDPAIDMGPNGLTVNQPRAEVLRRLDWDLGRFQGYVGINNHMGSRFTGDAQAMRWVMQELKARGLMFLDSRTIAASIGANAAATVGVPFAQRDVFLDDDRSASAVEQRLKRVETIARKKGTAIAIGHPHDATIDALIGWIAKLPREGIVLVPLTDIVKVRMGLG